MRRTVMTWILAVAAVLTVSATGNLATDTVPATDAVPATDTVSATDTVTAVEQPKKKMSWLRRTIRGFSYIDENYVEPQHYNWTVMLQAAYTYENYRLSSVGDNSQSVSFKPQAGIKLGPYVGWRWVILGYTIDLSNISFGLTTAWKGFDFSIYSAQIGADVYYHHTRDNYSIRNVKLGGNINTAVLEGMPFDGISVGTTGINLYYIFNHQRFSYPAAFAQSTCQKISCGSWMAGIGFLSNTLEFDYEKLMRQAAERLAPQTLELDSGLMFKEVNYYNINASVGYAYNWVFARNFLFCASLSLALAYKMTRGETTNGDQKGFNFNNLNIDGLGRFGVVYNNTRWYAGASAIIRTYNYKKSRFAANNILGSVNLYIGYNFGLRKQYKKKKTP